MRKTVVSVSLAALALAACGSTDTKTPVASHQRGGTLTVPWSGDVDSIDPGITYYSGGYMVAGVTQRTPIAYEPGRAAARPDLATALPEVSADGKTVTVKLMVGPSDGNGRQIAEIAKEAFSKLGFEVKLRLMSQQAVMTKYCGVPAAAVAVCPNVGWSRDFADGQTFLDPTFDGKHIVPVGNAHVSQLNVPSVNAAITAQAPAVPLVWDKVPMAASADVDAWRTRMSASGTSLSRL